MSGPRRRNLVGQRFDKRLVLAFVGSRSGMRSVWRVRCDCGREFDCLNQDLKRGGPCRQCTTSHKAPRPYRRKRPYEALYNTWSSRARYPVHISYEQFLPITDVKNCHYCDAEVKWPKYRTGDNRSSASNLDRKDCSEPYTLDNIVVCCWRCNKAKNTLFTYEEWKEIGALIRAWRLK